MSNAASNLADWMKEHLRLYLETDGEQGHYYDASARGGPSAVPSLLLTTVGRRSGRPQQLPLFYGKVPGGYSVVASKGGAPTHPAWYLNLRAHPVVDVQVGPRKFKARARVAEGEERTAIWRTMLEVWPFYDEYQANTEREIPVVVLEPIETEPADSE
jgi:deazaflavin-dependent oxidoreductase (nitroreductase family)